VKPVGGRQAQDRRGPNAATVKRLGARMM
jgi:hypothetical protein